MNMTRVSQNAQTRKLAQDIISRTPRKEQENRCVYAVAKQVLLNGRVLRNCDVLEPKIKNLGCGVYHIWYEPV